MESQFRIPGSPAGSHPHTVWSQCVLYDPYERVNFWSHSIPGLAFLLIGCWSYRPSSRTSRWKHNALGIFCLCATLTHMCSAITHVYPDSHQLEKLDHAAIVALIIGTPLTAIMAQADGELPKDIILSVICMGISSLLPPTLRVVGFILGPIVWSFRHLELLTPTMCTEIALYLFGAASFLRNGGHSRTIGFQDHHFLHYAVTVACCIHVRYLTRQAKM